MKAFVESFPEFKQLSANVQKHVCLSSELNRMIQERSLLDVSPIEQDMACSTDSQSAIFNRLQTILTREENPIKPYDALKLVLMFSLAYESDGASNLERLIEILRQKGITAEELNLIPAARAYCGRDVRSNDIFNKENIWTKGLFVAKKAFENVTNIYTQHRPYMMTLVDQLAQGKLDPKIFPFATLQGNPTEKTTDIIAFIVGGTTYEEAYAVHSFNSRDGNRARVVLGGIIILSF